MWVFWNQVAMLGELACMTLFLLAFLVIVWLFRWVCLLNLLVCLVLPPPLARSILSLPPTRTRVWIPFLLIFTSFISTPYPNQGLYPHRVMTGVHLVRGWGSLWLWKKKKMVVVVWVTLGCQWSLSCFLAVSWAQLDETLIKGDSHLIFTESGPFSFVAQVSCVYFELRMLLLDVLWEVQRENRN